jgi:hypothetical protein
MIAAADIVYVGGGPACARRPDGGGTGGDG